jgi:hypothetical protein
MCKQHPSTLSCRCILVASEKDVTSNGVGQGVDGLRGPVSLLVIVYPDTAAKFVAKV